MGLCLDKIHSENVLEQEQAFFKFRTQFMGSRHHFTENTTTYPAPVWHVDRRIFLSTGRASPVLSICNKIELISLQVNHFWKLYIT